MADSLFSPKDFNNADLKAAAGEDYGAKVKIIENWQAAIVNGKVLSQKEEQLQSNFLEKFFGDVLGYPYEKHLPEYMLENEPKTAADSTKPDGALGYFKLVDGEMEQDVRAVIELKGATVNLDKKQNRADFKGTPIEQAFGYVPKMGGKCKWVIVSNFLEIRLYHHSDITRYESFVILDLLKNGNLPKFLYLLQWGQLLKKEGSSPIDIIFDGRQQRQKTISYEFYQKYKDVRQHLFLDIRKHNPKIEPVTLFHCTQKLIDRIIFICFVKDMQIIDDVLKNVRRISDKSFSQSDDRIWTELRHLFIALDKGYSKQNIPPFNGGLFMTDETLDTLDIRDNKLEDLIDFALGYDFQSELNVNILGHIFEQSISDIEEIIASIQAETLLEAAEKGLEKIIPPATSKRKKDGIFYTPAYITRYIVEQSIGVWLEDRSHEILKGLGKETLTDPTAEDYQSIKMVKGLLTYNDTIKWHLEYWHQYEKQLRSIKVLDPACGSGAFLTQAFDYLFEEWKVLKLETKKLSTPWDAVLKNNQKEKTNPIMVSDYGTVEEWHLKKQIIVENIFGVDINPASVEITRLSLWLKTANRTESLANLEDNIRLGNSLIDDPEVAGDLAFDWNKSFKSIMDSGGFDVVVGNPPYVRQELVKHFSKFLENSYDSFSGKADLYVYFFEKGIKILKENGYLGFISSSKFLEANYGKPLLKMLFEKSEIKHIINFGDLEIFEGITAYPSILIIKNTTKERFSFRYYKVNDLVFTELTQKLKDVHAEIYNSKSFIENNYQLISNLIQPVFSKILTNSVAFENLYPEPTVGVKTGFNEGYLVEKSTGNPLVKQYVFGKDIKRYAPVISQNNLLFPYEYDSNAYKLVGYESNSKNLSVLQPFKNKLQQRAIIKEGLKNNSKTWYEFQQINKNLNFEAEYIVYPNVSNGNNFTLSAGKVIDMTAFIIPTNDKFLLSILNSKLTGFIMANTAIGRRGGYLEYKTQYLIKVPIKDIPLKKKLPFIKKVDLMLSGHKELHELSKQFLELLQADFKIEKPSNKLSHWYELDWDAFKSEIKKSKPNVSISGKPEENWNERFHRKQAEAQKLLQSLADTDKEIDRMVYELYGLSEEEVRIVEGGN